MSMDNTIIQQGRFTADGNAKILNLRSDVDWIRIYNETVLDAAGGGSLGEAYWQLGMSTGLGYVKEATIGALVPDTLTNGFTLIDTSDQAPGALNTTVTAVAIGAPTEVLLTSTAGLSNGDVVRMINVTGAQQIGGIDYTIENLVANTSFDFSYNGAGLGVAGTTGSLRRIPFDPIYYPRHRYICSMSQASTLNVQMTVTHGFTVGQEVRLTVPAEFGMVEADGLTGTVVAIDAGTASATANSIDLDIDSSAFTAYSVPATADAPLSPALVVPVGEGSRAGTPLDDATRNTAYIGIELAAGAGEPAGIANDVIYWVAGKSFSNLDEV